MRLLIVAMLLALLAMAGVLYREMTASADPVALVLEVNDFRETNSLPPLFPHPLVMQVAQNFSETAAQTGSPDIDENAVMEKLKIDGYVPVSYHILGWQGYSNAETEFNSLREQGYDDVLLEENMRQIGIGAAGSGGTVYYTLIITEFSACDPQQQEMVASVQQQQAQDVLALTNTVRVERGLHPLILNTQLYQAAWAYSYDMKQHGYPTHRQGGIAHIGTDGSDVGVRVRRTGYQPEQARENILMRGDMDAQGAFEMWWSSPPHQENLLADDVTEMGLAFTCNANTGEFYYTQVLGAPLVQLDDQTVVNAVYTIINNLRSQHGLSALILDPVLSQAAERESEYVVANKAFRNTLWDEVKNAGYVYQEIEVASVTSSSIETIEERLKSDSLRVILNANKSEIGIGVSRTGEGYYSLVIFIARPV